MRDSHRFVPGDHLGPVAPWNFGAVDSDALRIADQAQARQGELDAARDAAARQEGFADGFAQGHARALLEGERRLQEYVDQQGHEAARRFGLLIQSAHEQMQQSLEVMSQGVLELACELARQVVRQDLTANPNALQPVIREAIGLLAQDHAPTVVRLNPLDLEILRDTLTVEFSSLDLTLVADEGVMRAGCVVAASGAVVDATLSPRWRRAVARLGLDVPWDQDPPTP